MASQRGEIVVVDDDPVVRSLLCEAIAALEFTVVASSSYEEALAAVSDATALVLSDVNLGRRSGQELLAAVTAERPLLPVVLVSGDSAALGDETASRAAAVLVKPFSVAELQRLVLTLVSR